MLTQGAEVAAFETEFAETVAGRECVALASGTSALHLGLVAAGIGPGDEVIVPAFTFAATANAVVHAGARAGVRGHRPGDVLPRPRLGRRRRDPTHGGHHPRAPLRPPADMDAINATRAASTGSLVLEDACQAQGARYRGDPAGALADSRPISFYPTKTMTTGEGGMLVCRDRRPRSRARRLRNQGMSAGQSPTTLGYNARMTDVAAAIGRVQLGRVDDFLDARRSTPRAGTPRCRAISCRTGRRTCPPVHALHDPCAGPRLRRRRSWQRPACRAGSTTTRRCT